jgi:GTPase
MMVSAITGEGIDNLLRAIGRRLTLDRHRAHLRIGPVDGAAIHWLYENTEVLSRRDLEDGDIAFALRVAPDRADKLTRRFPQVKWQH